MDFAVFICTHGRPTAQHTFKALRDAGYTGHVYFVVDDEDDTIDGLLPLTDEFTHRIMFCKQHYIDTVDIGRRDAKRAAILYAKCACEDFAKEYDLSAFVIADDDITGFRHRFREDGKLKSVYVRGGLNEIFEAYVEFLLTGNVCMTSFAAVQMFIGGVVSDERVCYSRIPYNFLFRNASIPFQWISEMNEDTASVLSEHGNKFMLMLPFIKYDMKELMAGAEGGMTENYNSTTGAQRINTLIMYSPSNVYYVTRPNNYTHAIRKDNAFPKLISSSFKKS